MAIYPNGATSPYSITNFSSMADRRPDADISIERAFDTIIFESEAGYEARRLRSRRAKRSFDLTYTNITGLAKAAIENFYNARGGDYESFEFNLDHINETGIIRVRFEGPLSITLINSYGSDLTKKFYTVSFKLKEAYS